MKGRRPAGHPASTENPRKRPGTSERTETPGTHFGMSGRRRGDAPGTPARLPCGSGDAAHPANLRLLDGIDDGAIDLSDAVHAFAFPFLGGPTPAGGSRCLRLEGCPEAGCVP